MSLHHLDHTSDEGRFRALFDQYAERVHQYIYTITRSVYITEEVTQELFLILWRKRGDLHAVENMDGYIFRIARNLAIRLLKDAALDSKLANDLYKRAVRETNVTEESLEEKTVQTLIENAAKELPPQPQKIFWMSRKQNMNYDEIAEATGLSRNTVKNHLQKALTDIRDYLIRHGYQVSIAAILAKQYFW